MTLPQVFKLIRLNLARSKEFPAGSPRHGYEFVAPLDDDGHIDVDLWKEHRDECWVRRFWQGEPDQLGHLVHKPGGSQGARWIFDYDESRDDDDEAGYRFGTHVFAPGEYLTLRDSESERDYTFMIVAVERVA